MTRRLTRDTRNAVVAGVAAGFADYFGIDPVLARLAFILLAFLNGLGVLFYLACWVIMPRPEQVGQGSGSAEAAVQERVSQAVREAGDRVRETGERMVQEVQRMGQDPRRGQVVAGAILTALGVLFLLDRLDWLRWPAWVRLANLWPVILIAIGIVMILRSGPGREA